ncbi:hypothetical protein L249_7315 [Ophiocordyceps polyrhachis-furcata BCC 54312]|uniref:Uncharacterized protein n=1 Tax=Ophiocordyceps polyrhachis-furcata BCC 54312 TaxID=1330021 RepID=A0A367LAE1_9HYPO|nr:hypothetical protein L249_7315 [Ophiocordyceps polyrhachis-furcata BCC 54312]
MYLRNPVLRFAHNERGRPIFHEKCHIQGTRRTDEKNSDRSGSGLADDRQTANNRSDRATFRGSRHTATPKCMRTVPSLCTVCADSCLNLNIQGRRGIDQAHTYSARSDDIWQQEPSGRRLAAEGMVLKPASARQGARPALPSSIVVVRPDPDEAAETPTSAKGIVMLRLGRRRPCTVPTDREVRPWKDKEMTKEPKRGEQSLNEKKAKLHLGA